MMQAKGADPDHLGYGERISSYYLRYHIYSACLPFLFTHLDLNVVSICINIGNALLKPACESACKSSK